MVQIIELHHLEYDEAILDSPDFRDKLQQHEKYIEDTNSNIKTLLKRCNELINSATQLQNQQQSFSECLKEFTIGFVGNMNDEETYIVDTLNSISYLIDDIREYSNKMIDTSSMLCKQIHDFRQEKMNNLKSKKKEYDKQTAKYCQQLEKYLSISARKHLDENSSNINTFNANLTNTSSTSSNKIQNQNDDDKQVKDETQQFYRKCLDYANTIQEFEENWFQYFSESIFVFIKNWTTFYHEGYEKHLEYEPLFKKSQCNIQYLRDNYDYFRFKSKELISKLLLEPDLFLNRYQTMTNDQMLTTKQGYLYLFKKTLAQSSWTKYFCKYYKDHKKLEISAYNQLSSNHHSRKQLNTETYYIINCIQSINDKIDKRFIFDLICRDVKSLSASTLSLSQSNKDTSTIVLTFQALSSDSFKSWFSTMEGKDIPKSQRNSSEPIYILDNNGLKFIQKCIYILENDKRLIEEGIYRKNGVSHKIILFIEKYCENINVNIKSSKSSSSSAAASFSSSSLNNNENYDDIDTCTITGALKYFLIHCNEPIMTFKYNNDFLKGILKDNLSGKLTEIHYLLHLLPPANLEALKLLMKHLSNVSKLSKFNKMTISNLSTCFGPTLFRTEQECVTNLYNIKFYSEIIELLIMYHEKIFDKDFKASSLTTQDSTSTISLTTSAAPSIAVVSVPTGTLQQVTTPLNNTIVKLRRGNTSSLRSHRNGLYKPLNDNSTVTSNNQKINTINNSNLSLSSDSSHESNNDVSNNDTVNTPLSSSTSSFNNNLGNTYPPANKSMTTITPTLSATSIKSSNSKNSLNNNCEVIKQKHAITLFNCQADNPSELSFEADTILTNVKQSKESGWYEATRPDGKAGLVPWNYIKFIDEI